MLRISKLRSGQIAYYLGNDANGHHGHATESQMGYYTGGGEAPGTWTGAGVTLLGLAEGEVVDPAAMVALIEGRDPRDIEGTTRLVRDRKPPRYHVERDDGTYQDAGRRPGYDLTFSAPKSVSVLWAMARPDTQAAIEKAQAAAVRAAIAYLDDTAARIRRGKGGARLYRGDGLVGAAFPHRTSRDGSGRYPDPQLHTHVVIANVARGPDGRWSALRATELYAQAKTAGHIYQGALREAMTRDLGVAWTEVPRTGQAEIAGVPETLREAFSTRRHQILEEVRRHGHDIDDAEVRSAAAVATRAGKEGGARTDQLQEDWVATAQRHGWTTAELGRAVHQAAQQTPVRVAVTDEQVLVAATEHASWLDRRALIRALADADVPAADLCDRADRILNRPDVQMQGERDWTAGVDGQVVGAVHQAVYTTQAIRDAEARILTGLTDGIGAVTATPDRHVVAALAARPTISEEQAAMVRAITGSNRIGVVVAPAGAGKSWTVGVASEAWSAAGHRVIGCATAAKAAKELQAGSGIQSSTIARLLIDLDDGHSLERGTCLVVDEAGMVATDDLDRLIAAVLAADARLVLIGDPKQLSPVAAGGMFAHINRHHQGLLTTLSENRRQLDQDEQTALSALRGQDQGAANAIHGFYVQRERITVTDLPEHTRDQMVADYFTHLDNGDTALLLAHRRTDVAELNATALACALDRGELGDPLTIGGGTWHIGQRVLATRNDRRLGITNGDLGTVVAPVRVPTDYTVTARRSDGTTYTMTRIRPPAVGERIRPRDRSPESPEDRHDVIRVTPRIQTERLRVRIDGNRTVDLPATYIAEHLANGYATTIHKAQGATVDHSLVMADNPLDAELLYVSLSRGKMTNRVYLAAGSEPASHTESDNRMETVAKRLAAMATNPQAQEAAVTMQERRHATDLSDLTAERRRLAAVLANGPPSLPRLRHAAITALHSDERLAAQADDQHAGRWHAILMERRAAIEQLQSVHPHAVDVQRRYREWLKANAGSIHRWTEVTEAIRRIVAVRATAALSDPPPYLPPPPAGPLSRRKWTDQAETIMGYRERWGVTDEGHPLGARPNRPGVAQREWDNAAADLRLVTRERERAA